MYYKIVRVLNDGKRISSFISGGIQTKNEDKYVDVNKRPLEYTPGEITKDFEDGLGIFLYENLPLRDTVDGNVYRYIKNFNGVVEIYEAMIPVDTEYKINWYGRCPTAVKLTKLVDKFNVNNYDERQVSK